jgi:hypothetical protein
MLSRSNGSDTRCLAAQFRRPFVVGHIQGQFYLDVLNEQKLMLVIATECNVSEQCTVDFASFSVSIPTGWLGPDRLDPTPGGPFPYSDNTAPPMPPTTPVHGPGVARSPKCLPLRLARRMTTHHGD